MLNLTQKVMPALDTDVLSDTVGLGDTVGFGAPVGPQAGPDMGRLLKIAGFAVGVGTLGWHTVSPAVGVVAGGVFLGSVYTMSGEW